MATPDAVCVDTAYPWPTPLYPRNGGLTLPSPIVIAIVYAKHCESSEKPQTQTQTAQKQRTKRRPRRPYVCMIVARIPVVMSFWCSALRCTPFVHIVITLYASVRVPCAMWDVSVCIVMRLCVCMREGTRNEITPGIVLMRLFSIQCVCVSVCNVD